MKKSLILASLLMSTMAVTSTAMAATPSFDSVSVEYLNVKESSDKGWHLQGSKVLTDLLYVQGSYTDYDYGDLLTASLGVHYDLMGKATAFASADLLHADYDNTESDGGHGFSAGVKGMVWDNKVELGFTTSYSDIYKKYVWVNKFEASYYVSQDWSLSAGYTFVKDTDDVYSAKVSWHF